MEASTCATSPHIQGSLTATTAENPLCPQFPGSGEISHAAQRIGSFAVRFASANSTPTLSGDITESLTSPTHLRPSESAHARGGGPRSARSTRGSNAIGPRISASRLLWSNSYTPKSVAEITAAESSRCAMQSDAPPKANAQISTSMALRDLLLRFPPSSVSTLCHRCLPPVGVRSRSVEVLHIVAPVRMGRFVDQHLYELSLTTEDSWVARSVVPEPWRASV